MAKVIDLTLFFPMFPFDPPSVFWCSQGNQKGALGRKGLMTLSIPGVECGVAQSAQFKILSAITN